MIDLDSTRQNKIILDFDVTSFRLDLKILYTKSRLDSTDPRCLNQSNSIQSNRRREPRFRNCHRWRPNNFLKSLKLLEPSERGAISFIHDLFNSQKSLETLRSAWEGDFEVAVRAEQ